MEDKTKYIIIVLLIVIALGILKIYHDMPKRVCDMITIKSNIKLEPICYMNWGIKECITKHYFLEDDETAVCDNNALVDSSMGWIETLNEEPATCIITKTYKECIIQ